MGICCCGHVERPADRRASARNWLGRPRRDTLSVATPAGSFWSFHTAWGPESGDEADEPAAEPEPDFLPQPAQPRSTHESRLLIREPSTGRIFTPNGRGIVVNTPLFEGRVCVFTRTDPQDELFARKKRRIEIQVQGRFKQPPRGIVYLGAEVSHNLQLSTKWRAIAGICIAFARRFHRRVHIMTSGREGTDERPHMTLPIAYLVDAWHETPPGQEPPRLGTRIPPGQLDQIRTHYRPNYPFKPDHLYTFIWYSMYFDLEPWQISNIPGARGTSLHSFWNHQPMTFLAYAVPEHGNPHHGPSVRTDMFCIDMYHETHENYREVAADHQDPHRGQ